MIDIEINSLFFHENTRRSISENGIDYDSLNEQNVNPLRGDIIKWIESSINNKYIIFSKKSIMTYKELIEPILQGFSFKAEFIDEGQSIGFFDHYISFENADDAMLFKLTWV